VELRWIVKIAGATLLAVAASLILSWAGFHGGPVLIFPN